MMLLTFSVCEDDILKTAKKTKTNQVSGPDNGAGVFNFKLH